MSISLNLATFHLGLNYDQVFLIFGRIENVCDHQTILKCGTVNVDTVSTTFQEFDGRVAPGI
jgi:hypothetical protein